MRGNRKKTNKEAVRVGFVSLGCPKNTVDSERMLAEIAQGGFAITSELEDAEVAVVNTCGFIASAVSEGMEVIKEVVSFKNKGLLQRVIVTGCLVQRMGRELTEEVPGIDALAGLGERDNIVDIINRTLSSGKRGFYMKGSDLPVDDRTRLLINSSSWAYLRISEGCSKRCAFCTIPSIRGPFRSKPFENVIQEARELVSSGVSELNIIAQDSTNYGSDLGIRDGLAQVIDGLDQIDELEWVRLMYLYPTGITDRLIDAICSSSRVVHYLDMPVQHINNDILRAMRRPDTSELICGLIEKLRKAMDDMVLRSTLIVGLPGESEEMFQELMDFVKWARFDALGCFEYSPEPGTAAAEMDGQVDPQTRARRLQELMELQQGIAFEKNAEKIGRRLRCLIEPDIGGRLTGRYYGQAPEVDSVCIIEECEGPAGIFVDAEVVGSEDYDLVVRPVSAADELPEPQERP
jgi:ribosomal protein S12 methylthiotransferase